MPYRRVAPLGLALALACAACAGGAETATRVDTRGGPGGEGINFGDGGNPSDDTRSPTFDGPQLFDGPQAFDGPKPPAPDTLAPDTTPGVYDVDGDGHCAPGQVGPTCQSHNDCDDNDKTRYPGAPETCSDRGVDNDCDGDSSEVDFDNNGVNDIGEVCNTGFPGVCSTGKKACTGSNAAPTCVPDVAVGSGSESCNGLDDDCNGTVDDGNLCGAGETCAGASGCRCGSGPPCTGSNVCNGSTCGPPCNPSTNVALTATATSSGGGQATYGVGPDRMNDGFGQSNCTTARFHWLDAPNSAGTSAHWIQYNWSAPVTIGRVVFDTILYTSTTLCGLTVSNGRTLAGGTLQYLQGSTWVTITTISNQSNDWSRTFTPVTTTGLRLINAHAHSSGFKNPLIVEWQAFCQ